MPPIFLAKNIWTAQFYNRTFPKRLHIWKGLLKKKIPTPHTSQEKSI